MLGPVFSDVLGDALGDALSDALSGALGLRLGDELEVGAGLDRAGLVEEREAWVDAVRVLLFVALFKTTIKERWRWVAVAMTAKETARGAEQRSCLSFCGSDLLCRS